MIVLLFFSLHCVGALLSCHQEWTPFLVLGTNSFLLLYVFPSSLPVQVELHTRLVTGDCPMDRPHHLHFDGQSFQRGNRERGGVGEERRKSSHKGMFCFFFSLAGVIVSSSRE